MPSMDLQLGMMYPSLFPPTFTLVAPLKVPHLANFPNQEFFLLDGLCIPLILSHRYCFTTWIPCSMTSTGGETSGFPSTLSFWSLLRHPIDSGRAVILLQLTSSSTNEIRSPMEQGRVARYWKFWLMLRTSRLIRFSRSWGRDRRQLRRASRIRRFVRWEVEWGRNASLFEFTDSFLRFSSSKPIVSGNWLSLLKFALNS